jgi:hypothetical protein
MSIAQAVRGASSVESAEKKLTDAAAAVEATRSAVEAAEGEFADLIGRQALGDQGVTESVIESARKARDVARDRHERACIAQRAAVLHLDKARAADQRATTEAAWREVQLLQDEYRKQLAKLAKTAATMDAEAKSLIELAAKIQATSPRSKERPDVLVFARGPFERRLSRSIELSLPSLFEFSPETRSRFPGLVPHMSADLQFYADRTG